MLKQLDRLLVVELVQLVLKTGWLDLLALLLILLK
jgi:hypothetical protein